MTTTPPRTRPSKARPLAVSDPITDDGELFAVFERLRGILVDGAEDLDVLSTYIAQLITAYDKRIGKSNFGRKGRVRRVSNPLRTAGDQLLDAAAQLKLSLTAFRITYMESEDLPNEFKIRAKGKK